MSVDKNLTTEFRFTGLGCVSVSVPSSSSGSVSESESRTLEVLSGGRCAAFDIACMPASDSGSVSESSVEDIMIFLVQLNE